jgi:hypothetical protein
MRPRALLPLAALLATACASPAAPGEGKAHAIHRATRAVFGSVDPGPLVWIPGDPGGIGEGAVYRAEPSLVSEHADAIESLLAAHDGRAGHFTVAGASDDLAAQALWVALYRSRDRDLSRLAILFVGAARDEGPLRRLAAEMGVRLVVWAP